MRCKVCNTSIANDSIFCKKCGIRQSDEGRPVKKNKTKNSNGMGGIYFIKGRAKPWVARTPAYKNNEGKLVRKTIGSYETSVEAQQALEKYRGRPAEDMFNYTFTQIYELWSATHFSTIGYKGQKGYEGAYNLVTPLWNKKYRILRTEDFQRCININAEKYSLSQLQKISQLFNQLSRWAVSNDIVDRNYAEFIKLPKKETEEKRVFTYDEITAVESMVEDKRLGETAKITMTLLYTGMRIGELMQMRSEDVNIFEGYMIGGNKTKAGKRRKIPIHSKIKPYIAYWIGKGSEWLIPSSHGNARSTDTVRKGFNSLMQKLEIEGVTPHSCRHTYISRAVAAGMNKDVLAAIVGHVGEESTKPYVHIGVEQVIAAGGLIG